MANHMNEQPKHELPMNTTVPVTVYKTPDPQQGISELYTIYAQVLPIAPNAERCWVIKEKHGYWDENARDPQQKFKHQVTTLSPEDPMHCLTIEEVHKQIDAQVLVRAKNGFEYMFTLNQFDPPWFTRFQVLPDGSYKKLP